MRLTPSIVRAFSSRFLIALLAVTFTVGSFIRVGAWYEDKKIAQIPRASFGTRLRNAEAQDDPAQPGNFLIVGNDSRSFVRTAQDRQNFGDPNALGGTRSDTIMIAHLDPAAKVAMLVSIPRDIFVEIPGCGIGKINGAFNSDMRCGTRKGGPQLLVDTIQQNFGVPINHYLEVDFVGFRQIVDVVGYVELYFPSPARDVKTGLSIPAAGCRRLDGLMALNYARSRYYEWKDPDTGQWRDDPRSDFGRIARQQYFIRTLMQRAIDVGARKPWKAKDMIDKIVPRLVADTLFQTSDFNRLARSFRSLDPSKVQMITVPTRAKRADGQDGLELEPAAEPIFATLRGFSRPLPTLDPSTVTIDVQNGGAATGTASAALAAFVRLGFRGGQAADAAAPVAATEVRVTAAKRLIGEVVRTYLGGAGAVVEVPGTGAADVVVVAGPDFTAVRKPGSTTTTVTPTTPTIPTTTTTIPPNPGQPPAGSTPGQQVIGCR